MTLKQVIEALELALRRVANRHPECQNALIDLADEIANLLNGM